MYNEARITELLSRLPHPGGTIPEGVSDEALAGFAERVGIPIPLEVAELLKLSNAPHIGSQGLLGITGAKYRNMGHFTDSSRNGERTDGFQSGLTAVATTM